MKASFFLLVVVIVRIDLCFDAVNKIYFLNQIKTTNSDREEISNPKMNLNN